MHRIGVSLNQSNTWREAMSSVLPLPPGVVGEFVGRAHVELARVKELLTAYPTLIHAEFDWGNGDWETALGAAAHSGRKDSAEFLLAHGARLDIFAAAMLGKLGFVKHYLHEMPEALHQGGPHGISLLEHAKKGGDKEMVAYLENLIEPKPRVMKHAAKAAKKVVKVPVKAGKAKRRKAA